MKIKLSFANKIIAFAVLINFYILFFNTDTPAQKKNVSDTKINSTAKIADKFDADNFQIFTLINAERAKENLSLLLWNDDVAEIARQYSVRMADENFFGHFDPNGQGVLGRVKTAKLKYWSKIGENLFSCENIKRIDSFAVKNWMKSPTHRQNILDPEWTATGIGIARSKAGETFITQIFIKR